MCVGGYNAMIRGTVILVNTKLVKHVEFVLNQFAFSLYVLGFCCMSCIGERW